MKEHKKHIDRMSDIPSNQPYFDVPESFLKDLEKRLDEMDEKKKKKRRFIWFFFLSITLLATVSGSYLLNASWKRGKKAGFEMVSDNSLKKDSIEKAESTTNNNSVIKKKELSAWKKTDYDKKTEAIALDAASRTIESKNTFQANTSIDTEIYNGSYSVDNTPLTKKEESPVSSENLLTESSSQTDSVTLSTGNKRITEDNAIHLTEKHQNDSLTLTPATNWLMEIQLYTGIGANLSRNKSTNPEYTSILKSYESQTITPIIGVNGLFSYKKLAFGIGIGYYQNGEKYTLDLKTSYLKDSTISYMQNDTLYTYTIQYIDTMVKSTTFKNQYSQLSIPLSFGYRFQKRNFECIPRLGVQFDIGLLSRYGSYPADKPLYTTTLKSRSFSVSYALQIELRRNIGNWHIFTMPYFRSSITPNISEAILNRKYSSYGILIGAGYRF